MLNPLERRIIELSYKHKLSHISSCLNTVNVLEEIYLARKQGDPVILANGHAGLALYVALENVGLCNAEEMIHKHGVHPSRDEKHGISCSSGSLGQAETIAVGMGIAWPERTVYLVTSDGACAEGSVWEAFHLAADQGLKNLKITIIANGFGAYGRIDAFRLFSRLQSALCGVYCDLSFPIMPFEWLKGLGGHYVVMNEEQYNEAMA